MLTDADNTATAVICMHYVMSAHKSTVGEAIKLKLFEKGACNKKTLRNWKGVAKESNKQPKNKAVSNLLRGPHRIEIIERT